MRRLVLASAGAGKSRLIVKQSLRRVNVGEKVLILTYTERNQKELVKKFCKLHGVVPASVTIKGWFSFLLEDLIRPYQSYLFHDRIPGINFNPVDPHKKNGRNIPGRGEKYGGEFNAKHFLTSNEGRAHTTYISKLAVRVNSLSAGMPILRLCEIYQAVCIDEVQDLIGWDFEVIKAISKSCMGRLSCVGDFRQTLYSTHPTTKKPKANNEKLERLGNIGLRVHHLSISWRCIQEICDFADLVHKGKYPYDSTLSKLTQIDHEYADHLGVFIVKQDEARSYLEKYQPAILRINRNTQKELCNNKEVYNFGEAKGMGFNRVLICATDKHKKFLAGKMNVFDNDRTDKARNTLYVAITRAKFSVAFLCDVDVGLDVVQVWSREMASKIRTMC